MKLLLILLNITYYIFFVSFIILIPFLFLIRFDIIPELTKDFSDDQEMLTYIKSTSFIIEMVAVPLYLIMIYKIKALVSNFSKKEYFSIENSKYIKYIGWLLIFIYIIEHILSEHLLILLSSTTFFIWLGNFNIIEFLLMMFFKLIIGMLLLSIGKAFELGLKQQQENELTI